MKKIGIPAWMTGKKSFGVDISYMSFIERFGKPIIIDGDIEKIPEVDLLILPGGADILPTTYGERPSYYTNKPNIHLEYFDANILPIYLERNTPIFGICRGAQRLWVMYGGKIIQHYNHHKQSLGDEDQCHKLYFVNKYKNYSNDIDKVTSRHHQMMDGRTNIPSELEIIAFSASENPKLDMPECHIVEIFKHKTLPIIGVQYHPENHNFSDKLNPFFIDSLLNNIN